MILTVDAGTSATKVAVWGDEGLAVLGRAPVATRHPRPGWAEQDATGWWDSVVAAAADARDRAPRAFGTVTAVSCAGARQTFVPVTAAGRPLGPALVWSDRRAGAEAATLRRALGPPGTASRLTGVPLDAEAVAAKVAWLAAHEPDRLGGAAWLLSPRDLVLWRLCGEVVTDATMAGRSGLYDLDGRPVDALVGPAGPLLPAVVAPGSVVGHLQPGPAAQLGVRPGVAVVAAAGDRACEALGAGASASRPLVSWGTTANTSGVVVTRPHTVPPGLVLTPGASGDWLLEGGLSAAGSLVTWLGQLTGRRPEDLAALAAGRPAGARGVLVLPWLDGARAPWWHDGARAAVLGLSAAHDAADLARAVYEAVAFDVVRCLRAMAPATGPASALALGGAGAAAVVWTAVLTSVAGLAAQARRSAEAASAGAALLAWRALGDDRTIDDLDPVGHRVAPDQAEVARYAALWARAERAAGAVIDLDLGLTGGPDSTADPGPLPEGAAGAGPGPGNGSGQAA